MGTIEISSPRKTHILAFPFPAKGHINPMLHLCNRLASKGFRVTFITTISTYKDVKNKIESKSKSRLLINLESIPDGTEKKLSMSDYFNKFRDSVTKNVSGIIEKYKLGVDFPPPKVFIYDSTIPWMLDVAHGHGILGASLFTQPCCVSAVYYHMLQGTLDSSSSSSRVLLLPCLPPLEDRDLPGFDYFKEDGEFVSNLLSNQFLNIDKIDYVLFNTFEKLEAEIANWMSNKWKILTIGPTAPTTVCAGAALETEEERINNYVLETKTEVCMKWLNEREPNSVIYVSFGSIASLTELQMEEILEALLATNFNFLWVVREEERAKLPNYSESSSGIVTGTGKLGLIVNWCPQLEVLSHESLACFMTHCGWNSTLEAICSGVVMIGVPQWVDQTTNAKFIEDVWKIGVRVKNNSNGENGGLVKKEEIERCIKEVCESEKGKELKRNAMKWKELAKEAVSEGGSSDTNLDYFASTLLFY